MGCEPKAPVDLPAATIPVVAATPMEDFEPLPARLALPTQVLAMRLPPGSSVGTYFDAELPDGVPLRAVGLNLCQPGWILQGFIERDGALAATPPLPLPYATLPTLPTQIRDPRIPSQALVLDFDVATMRHLKGTIRVSADDGQPDPMKMTIDGAPIGISTGPGIGAQGCFTTGYYQVQLGTDVRVGPVSAVWDQKRLHYVGLRLTDKYGIGIWLHLEPAHRQPQNIIRGDLATVAEKLERFPFRVVFETRETTPTGVEVQETPATAGRMMAAFVKASPQGPIRIDLEQLQFPAWDGPLSGVTADKIRVEALLVTDIEGSGVPVPSEPRFEVSDAAKRPE